VLVLLKTRRSCFPRLASRVRELHPYSVPEIIALPVASGSPAYLAWVAASTTEPAFFPNKTPVS
jgi:periplasmic divalent cation tolerance protein